MKTRWLLWLSMCFVIILTGCQSKVATTQPGGGYPPPGQETASLTQAYPAPVQQSTSMANSSALYPAVKDGDTVSWDQTVGMIQNGEVAKVTQSQSLKVILTLKDGRSLTTAEPSIDEVVRVITACGNKCKDIIITKE